MINKLTWAQARRVTERGRYMFEFGWLTITAEDLYVWKNHPYAIFTLVKAMSSPGSEADEFRLGTFELEPGNRC